MSHGRNDVVLRRLGGGVRLKFKDGKIVSLVTFFVSITRTFSGIVCINF